MQSGIILEYKVRRRLYQRVTTPFLPRDNTCLTLWCLILPLTPSISDSAVDCDMEQIVLVIPDVFIYLFFFALSLLSVFQIGSLDSHEKNPLILINN